MKNELNSLLNTLNQIGQPVPVPTEAELAVMVKPRKCTTQRCQKIFDARKEGKYSYGRAWYCGRCTDRYLVRADDTGKLHYRTHLHNATRSRKIYKLDGFTQCSRCQLYTEYPGRIGVRDYCESCYADEKRIKMKSACTNVLDYCATQPRSEDGLLLGIEWELDDFLGSRDVAVDKIVQAIGDDFCIAKGDGSLDNGAEFVTAPAGMEFLLERLRRGCEVINAGSIEIEDNEAANSGIHIHVARDFFTDDNQIEKFISFINNPANEKLVTAVARRYNNRWARITRREGTAKPWYNGAHSNGKYSAVNTQHRNSLEVRLFYSTTKYHQIAGRVQFVSAVARMCKLEETPILASAEYFFDYLRPQIETYPQLWGLIKHLDKASK